jgi:hypothetical protein
MRPIAYPTKYSITTLTLDNITAVAVGPIRYSPSSPYYCNRLPTEGRLYLVY